MNRTSGFSRRAVLRMAAGAGFAAAVGVASDGSPLNQVMAQAGDTQLRCISSGVRLRGRPGLSGAIVATLKEGEIVNLTGKPIPADGYSWLPVTSARGAGFVASQFFIASQGGIQIGTDVVTTDSVRLRREAGLGGAVIRTLPPGTHAVIRWAPISRDGYTWYGVILDDGTEGFIAGEFLAREWVEPTGQLAARGRRTAAAASRSRLHGDGAGELADRHDRHHRRRDSGATGRLFVALRPGRGQARRDRLGRRCVHGANRLTGRSVCPRSVRTRRDHSMPTRCMWPGH